MSKKAKQLEDGSVVVHTEVQKLPVKLDEKGIALAGIRLAKMLQNQGEFEAQAKRVKGDLKAQEDAITGDIERQAQAIRDGVEIQGVEVEVRADFSKGIAEFVRTDTGETLTTRNLTDNERQKRLVFKVEEEPTPDSIIESVEPPTTDIAALAGRRLDSLTAAEKEALAKEANKSDPHAVTE